MELTTAQANYVASMAQEIDKSFLNQGAKNLLAPASESDTTSSSDKVDSLQLLCCRFIVKQRVRIPGEDLKQALPLEVQALIVQSQRYSLRHWVFINLSLDPQAVHEGTKDLLQKNGFPYGLYDVVLRKSPEQTFFGHCFKQMIETAPSGHQKTLVEKIVVSMNSAKPITEQRWNRLHSASEKVTGVTARILKNPIFGLILGIVAYLYAYNLYKSAIHYARDVIIPRVNHFAIQHLPLWAVRQMNQGLKIAEMFYQNVGIIWFYSILTVKFGPQFLRPTAGKIETISWNVLVGPIKIPFRLFMLRIKLFSKVVTWTGAWTRQGDIQLDQIKEKATNQRLGPQIAEAYQLWLKWAPHWRPQTAAT